MKACPTCDRTFENSFTFCLIDGAVLSPPFDSSATQRIPEARTTKPPPTAVLPSNAEARRQELPATRPSPGLQPTLPSVPLEYSPPARRQRSDDDMVTKPESLEWIVGGLAMGMVLGIIIGVLRPDSKDAIVLGVLGALVGAIMGKVISNIVQKDAESKS